MRSNATSCPYCQYSLCLSCTLCPRSDSNETGIQSSWRKELSCRASHGMMRKMNKITERFVTGFAFSLTTSFAHKCKNTWNTELGYRGRAHTQSQRKILLNYLILGLLKVNKASLHRSCLPGTPGGITGSLHFGWSCVSKISSSISSPPRSRFLSRWCLTSTLPGEHWGWELIKSEKCLLLLSINCFLKSCWIFQWPLVPLVPEKISSFLTFSSVFSPFSFALQPSPTLHSVLLFDLLILFVIASDAFTHPNLPKVLLEGWIWRIARQKRITFQWKQSWPAVKLQEPIFSSLTANVIKYTLTLSV